jgi:hypothetical protein
MKAFISTRAYSEDFRTHIRTIGWGCGYVHIPKDHPILVKTLIDDGWGNYLTPEGCPQEITFTQWDEEKEHLVIGFDTAHGHNNDSHDEAYVVAQADIIKDLVNAYTAEDARKYAEEQLELVKTKFSKYL